MRTFTFWPLLGCSGSSLFYACPYPSSKPRESQITIPATLLRDLCIHPSPPFLHTSHCHLSDYECVAAQASPALHSRLLPPPVPQREARPVRAPAEAAMTGRRGSCGAEARMRPGSAALFTKADRDLLPHSQTTICHIPPQTRFPCKPNILQPLLSSSVFVFPSQARLT